jgi:hypothetical protein
MAERTYATDDGRPSTVTCVEVKERIDPENDDSALTKLGMKLTSITEINSGRLALGANKNVLL